jgi:hypothetical protein
MYWTASSQILAHFILNEAVQSNLLFSRISSVISGWNTRAGAKHILLSTAQPSYTAHKVTSRIADCYNTSLVLKHLPVDGKTNDYL